MSIAHGWRRAAFTALIALLGALLLVAPALADPPGRVGRIAELQGQVWLYDDMSGEWITAVRNRPVTSGDRLATERDARLEVRVGSTAWRLAENTEVEIERLDDEAIRLHLHRGSVALRLRSRDAAGDVQVLTADGRFVPVKGGHYRIDKRDESSTATAWSGALRFLADDSQYDVDAGRSAEFWRESGRTHYTTHQPARDRFADWAIADDWRDERSASHRYVSPEMTGAEDLDRHGQWQHSDEYGALWMPYRVAPGWAPYRYGHWAWVAPWGWTWVDDAPWGFAPFHYGRWVWYGSRWAWAPGRWVARPVYAPALVAWIGSPGVSVSVQIGSRHPPVGWFPLGPREVYVPGYRVSHGYVRNLNHPHVPNVGTVIQHPPTMSSRGEQFVNRNVPGALTVVPANVITSRQPVSRFVDPRMVQEVARAPVSTAAPVTAPPRAARVESDGGGASPRAREPQQVGVAREVVPPPPGRPAVTESRGGRPRDDGRPMAAPAQPMVPLPPAQPAPPVQPARPQLTPVPPAAVPVQPAPRAPVMRDDDRGGDRGGDRGNGRPPGHSRGEPARVAPPVMPTPQPPVMPMPPQARVVEPPRAVVPPPQAAREAHERRQQGPQGDDGGPRGGAQREWRGPAQRER